MATRGYGSAQVVQTARRSSWRAARPARVALAALGLTALGGGLGSCKPTAPVERAAAPDEPPTNASSAEPASEGASWRYHPPVTAELRDGAQLPDGSWLLVGERGERWHARRVRADEPRQAPQDAASLLLFARAAPMRLPETLHSVVAGPGSQWMFVGDSGNVYAAEQPLGPCVKTTRPPGSLGRVVGSTDGLVALDVAGRLLRYAPTSGWSSPAAVGARLFDVAATGQGALLALSAPEALLASRDGGRHWTPIAEPQPVGAQRLLASTAGGVLVDGVHGRAYWDGAADRVAVATDQMAAALPFEDDWLIVPERGPRASALAERQAVLSGSRYYEAFESAGEPMAEALVRLRSASSRSASTGDAEPLDDASQGKDPSEPSRWLWAAGTIDAPLGVRELPVAEGCDSVRLGAWGERVVLACVHFDDAGEHVLVDVQVSDDGGSRWHRATTLEGLDTELVSVAVAADGSVLLAGVCERHPSDPCRPVAPLRLPRGHEELAKPVQAPDLVSVPRALAFGPTGRDAYWLGRRGKDDQVALFRSEDGGRTFASRSLGHLRDEERSGAEPAWDLGEELPGRSLHPGADGQLGIVLQLEPPVYAVADVDGRLERVAELPPDTVAASGSGSWVLALGSGTDEGADPSAIVAWESTDGGVSFRRVPTLPGLSTDEFEALSLHCSQAGCVVGDRATRVGWGEPQESAELPAPALEPAAIPSEPAVAPPIECDLDPAADWTRIDGVAFDGALPDASQAMRGPSAWSVLQVDEAQGEVVALSARAGRPESRLERRVLLGRPPRPVPMAYELSPQMEGYAVARLATRADAGSTRAADRTVELAWIDYVHGSGAQADLTNPEVMPAIAGGRHPSLSLELLSVSPRGLFVRPHPSSTATYWIEPSGRIRSMLRYPSWPAFRSDFGLRADAVFGDGGPLAVALLQGPARQLLAVGAAPLGAAAGAPVFTALAPPFDERRQVDTSFGYLGDAMGVAVHVVDLEGAQAWASFSPLGPDGRFAAALALPTQLDLGGSPRACSPAERSRTPRLLAPFVAGTRHPVLVRARTDSFLLLTDWAVLHGTPAAPCVAAWAARQLQRTPADPLTALIGGDPEQSWLFRPAEGVAGSIDYRPMRCRLATGPVAPQEIPRAIWLEPGTLRPRR